LSKLMVVSCFCNFVEESAIAWFEFCINFPFQFLIDVLDDEAPSRTLALYDRAALVAVTKIHSQINLGANCHKSERCLV
jgi:hypothetical protein